MTVLLESIDHIIIIIGILNYVDYYIFVVEIQINHIAYPVSSSAIDLKLHSYYRIEQNFGGKKNWRNCDFETLAEKTLANPRLACIFVLHREFWRKKLGELWRFAKFAKIFSPPKFCSIRYT